jgi:hypothetical protein
VTARKPNELHRRDGTLNTTKHGASPAKPPAQVVDPIGDAQIRGTVQETFQAMLDTGVLWLARTDAPKVLMVRDSLAERQRLLELIAIHEDDLQLRKALRDLNREISNLMGELGFDPAARSRLGLAEVKAQSKLEELRSRRGDGSRSSDG